MSDSRSLNAFLLKSTAVAALGGLLFGFDTAVIAGTTSALQGAFDLSPVWLGVTVSSALWGTAIGALFAGIPSDRYGRRASLRMLAICYLVSALGCAVAWNWHSFLFFRAMAGLAVGGSSVIGPMYIAEIAPASKRGRLVGLFQLSVVVGVLMAYFSNYLIGLATSGELEWRLKLGVAAAPAALFFVALFGIPQSPRWLVRRGEFEEAREVFRRIGEPDPDQEVAEVRESLGAEDRMQEVKLLSRKYRFPIFLAVTLAMFNQLSGINVVIYYLNDLFARAGYSKLSSDLQAVGIGLTNLVVTLLAMSVIDRLGRKKLLLIGAAGTCVCLAGVATIFAGGAQAKLLLWLLMAYIGFFAFSQGAVIWVYLSEVFPNLVRAKGQSLGSFTHWIMNAGIAGIFPAVAAVSGAIPFYFFSVMMLVQFFVVLFVFPETKGMKLEDMENLGSAPARSTAEA